MQAKIEKEHLSHTEIYSSGEGLEKMIEMRGCNIKELEKKLGKEKYDKLMSVNREMLLKLSRFIYDAYKYENFMKEVEDEKIKQILSDEYRIRRDVLLGYLK